LYVRPDSGENGGKATQAKWETAKNAAKSGNLEDVDPQIFICHYNTLKRIRTDYQEKPRDLTWMDQSDCPNLWLWGPPGTGKSYAARSEPGFYIKQANKWWCTYDNEPIVLIEDLDRSHSVLGHHIKIWADKYHFKGEVKQGSLLLRPAVIKITSNYHPNQIWTEGNMLDPILRRFKVILYDQVYKKPIVPIVNDIIQIADEESCSDTEIFPSLDDIILNQTSVIKK